jgi:DNA-binding transcriptional LysR family regulator
MTNVNLKLLQTFLLAAEHGSFRRAAEESHRSASAVSMQIRDLEEQVGISLFLRTPRRATLTPEGRLLYEQVRRAMQDVQAGLDRLAELSAERGGHLRIACAPSLAASRFPAILERFAARFPRVTVELRETPPGGALPLLQEQRAEFYVGPEMPHLEEFHFEPVLDDPLVVCMPQALRPAPGGDGAGGGTDGPIGLAALEGVPLILLSPDTAVRGLIDRLVASGGPRLVARYEVASTQAALALAMAGLGACIVPGIALAPEPPAGLCVQPLGDPGAHRAVGILTARGYVGHGVALQLMQDIRAALRPAT